MGRKFNKPRSNKNSIIISQKEKIKVQLNSYVSFSFKYYVEKIDKFSFSNIDEVKYLPKMIDRLKGISTFTMNEFLNNGSASLRCHPIKWSDENVTEDSFGLNNEDEIVDTPFQFAISQNKYGRVHGFIIDSTFYIRWIDPSHNLYK